MHNKCVHTCSVFFNIDIFLLDRPPQSLNPNIIQEPSFPSMLICISVDLRTEVNAS